MASNEAETVLKHTKYYMEGGDCAIRVCNTLFRIHRGCLTRESSIFDDVFAIPQSGETKPDGLDDDQPIVLTGDTVAEFEALCWILYALPHEIPAPVALQGHAERLHHSTISRLLSLASIAHKYQFNALHTWARGYINYLCFPPSSASSPQQSNVSSPSSRKNLKSSWSKYYTTMKSVSFPKFSENCSSEDFRSLLRYAAVSNWPALQKQVKERIMARVDSKPRSLSLSEALSISEHYDWKDTQGLVYYRIVCEAAQAPRLSQEAKPLVLTTANASSRPVFPHELSIIQRDRAVQGHATLLAIWDHIMENKMTPQAADITITPCRNTHTATWPLPPHTPAPVDIISRLSKMEVLAGETCSESCVYRKKSDWETHRDALIKSVKAALPDIFLGSEGEAIKI